MDNPVTTMEEYVQFETKKALRHDQVYNWEAAKFGKISCCLNTVDTNILRFFETKFPFIVYDDALKLKSDSSSKSAPDYELINNARMEKVTKDEHKGESETLNLLKIDVNLFTSDTPLRMIYDEFFQGWWGKKEEEGSSEGAWSNYVPNEEWKRLEQTRMNDGNTIQFEQECNGDYRPMIGFDDDFGDLVN
ncbi:hypothetical protein Tco_1302788 [Tanacetum coccineum]